MSDLIIAGASYPDVPSIVVPLADGSGYATYTEGGGGLEGITELYSADNVSISYTSTSAGTAKSITGISGLALYPLVLVRIENTDASSGSLKFIRSSTVISNTKYDSSSTSVVRYGTMQYYNSSSARTGTSSTTYGLWGYTISTAGALTIRGRCYSSYFTSLTGTYKVRVYGLSGL